MDQVKIVYASHLKCPDCGELFSIKIPYRFAETNPEEAYKVMDEYYENLRAHKESHYGTG